MKTWQKRIQTLATVLSASVLLAACGGGGGGSGGGSSSGEVPNANNNAPANVQFVEVSSAVVGQITASWLPATDDATPASNLTYELHAGADASFAPSTSTRLFEGRNVFQATVGSGLAPGTRYAFKLVVIDGQGASTTSNVLSATVSDTNATLNQGVRVTNLDGVQGVSVSGDQITIQAGASGWQTGQFVVSAEGAEGKGQLRRVESITSVNGATVLQTRIASVNEVVSDVKLSSSFKLASVAREITTASQQAGLARSASAASSDASAVFSWPQTGFRYSTPPSTVKTQAGLPGTWEKAKRASLTQGAAVDETNRWSRLYMPSSLIVTEGETADFNIHTYIADRSEPLIGQRRKICQIGFGAIRGVGEASRPSAISLQAGVGRVNNQDAYRPTHIIYPTTIRVGAGAANPNPYTVNVTLYVEELDQDCNAQTFWDETVTLPLTIYVANDGAALREKEVLAPTFLGSGDLSVTNNMEITFQPTISFDAVLVGARLSNARIQLDAAPLVEQTLRITSSAQGTVDETVNILPVRKFFKVYVTPVGIPIVVSGEYLVDMTIRGNVSGAIDATQKLTIGFDELSYGIEYVNGQYNLINQRQPVYRLSIGGQGRAEANLEVTLKPRLVLSAYESATGTVELEPYLNAQVGIEGHVQLDTEVDFNSQQINLAVDADYRLTKGTLGGGVRARLGAELNVWDFTLAAWPAAGQLRTYDLVEDTDFLSLPSIAAAADTQTRHTTDSRAIAFQGTVTTLPNPLRASFPNMVDTFLTWAQWTNARIVPSLALDSSSYRVLSSDPGDGASWVLLTQPGTYTVRQGGYSSLGSWARQYVETNIDVRDDNANSIMDFWEQRYGLQGSGQAIAAADPDADGLTNLQEWMAGSDPLVPGSLPAIYATATNATIGQTILVWLTGAYDAVTSVVWSFGDSIAAAIRIVTGGSSEGDSAEVVYVSAGQKTITATYRDAIGNTVGASTVTVSVTAAAPPAPSLAQAQLQTDGTVRAGGSAAPGATVRVTWPNGATNDVLVDALTGSWAVTSSANTYLAGQIVSAASFNSVGTSGSAALAITGGSVVATERLPDTGITASQCYAAGSDAFVSCTSAEAIALNDQQDGMVGRDVTSPDNTDGKLGFSYSKLDASGNALPASAASWSCVRDNITGLIWEVKTTDGGLRDMNRLYTNVGDNRSGDASAFPAAVNATSLCGYTDWRLPTAFELQGIVDYGVAYSGPTVDGAWFINTLGTLYWSSSPNAGDARFAWSVYFNYGLVTGSNRLNDGAVRLVR